MIVDSVTDGAPDCRYFLGFQVGAARAVNLLERLPPMPPTFKSLDADRLHLTLCVIAETAAPHLWIRDWIAQAFASGLPPAGEIRFGRVLRTAKGAELVTSGSREEIRYLYSRIVALLRPLAGRGILPLYRQSGLRPHVTLGYGPCRFASAPMVWNWTPRELVLIESLDGCGCHRVLDRWALEAPPQRRFAFLEDVI